MDFNPQDSCVRDNGSAPASKPELAPAPQPAAPSSLAEYDWQTAYREWLPYWQQRDPVPPMPAEAPEIETPGETLTERQEAFCRAYAEAPVAAKAAVAAGYSPASARKQASRLLKHPLIVRRLHALREGRGLDFQLRRDTIIDQAEAVYEAAMEKNDFYAAMQALTMKARMAGFADYLPGVRILRREPRAHEQEFWARAHAAEQRIMAARLGDIPGAAEAAQDATMFAESAEAAAEHMARESSGEAERRARAKRGLAR